MAYTKTTWVSGTAPGISAANLNNLETQYDEAVAYADALVPVFASGSYVGNSAANRAVAHGLGRAPKIVFIWASVVGSGYPGMFRIMTGWAYVLCDAGGGAALTELAVTAMDATNFYVGNAGGYPASANQNAITYYYVVFG